MNERIKELAKLYLCHERFTRYGESIMEEYYEFYPEDLENFVEQIKHVIHDKVKEELIDNEIIQSIQIEEDRAYLEGNNGGVIDSLYHIKNFASNNNETM